jgi:ATP-dependent DNA helicase RecQ
MTAIGAGDYLLNYFGFTEFREGQAEVIQALVEGRDSVVVMPTGGGKSLCYQLPAIMLGGVTLVISPLIALMKDQVDALSARGIPATYVNSSLSYSEVLDRLAGIRRGGFKIIYIAPERFRNQAFTSAIAGADVRLFAVDEAHCISHWGHDFRPDYLRLTAAAKSLRRPPIVALTATATDYVRKDIARQLQLKDPRVFVAGFDRSNLRLQVVHIAGDKQKLAALKEIVARSARSGIIYAATRKAVESISGKLKMAGLSVEAYHAGMNERERTLVQERFMTGQSRAIIATNAFGMGIDKPDIRFVAHYHLPGSIESYYQEIGRAGRDGAPADCFLLFNYVDTRTQRFFIEGSHPSADLIGSVYQSICRLGSGGKEVTARDIQSQLGIKNEMSVQSSLAALERAGHIERGRQTEAVFLAALAVPPDAGLGATSPTSVEGLVIRHLIYARGISDSESNELDVDSIAEETGLGPPQARAALNKLAARGIISCKNAYRGRGVRLAGNRPADQLGIDRKEISARATAENMKLRKMIDYCYSKRCLRAFILNYFGDGKKIRQCEACSACAPGQAPPWLEAVTDRGAGVGTLRVPGGGQPQRPGDAAVFPAWRAAPPLTPARHPSGPVTFSNHPNCGDVAEFPEAALPTPALERPGRDSLGSREEMIEAGRPPNIREHDRVGAERPAAINRGDSDECLGGIDEVETVVVKKILSCVARLNGRFGKGTVASVLKGAGTTEIAAHNLQKLPTYGLLSYMAAQEVAAFIKSLIRAGCIAVSKSAYPTLSITDFGREVMHGASQVHLPTPESARTAGELFN